jgi:tetratricopeptide (TPR) repeat protein
MKNLFGDKGDPEHQAREAIRHRKWIKAIAHFERRLQENPRDFAMWNLLGDLHMNNQAQQQAVEAWRRALEGYALEGLHENVLGIARKILRRAPEEDDVHLLLAEAFLGLEYHADCLAAFRTYLKMSKRRSESEMRSLFKHILDASITHPHLLEELRAIYAESQIEDVELEQRLQIYVQDRISASPHKPKLSKPKSETVENDVPYSPFGNGLPESEGLRSLDGFGDSAGAFDPSDYQHSAPPSTTPPAFSSDFDMPSTSLDDVPAGEGKDHYDLGVVYKEMKLWDAAIAEFEHARRDRSVRLRATVALAECMQESNDFQGALELLEREEESADASPQDLNGLELQIGILYEMQGNLDLALERFRAVKERNPNFGGVETRIAEIQSRIGAA